MAKLVGMSIVCQMSSASNDTNLEETKKCMQMVFLFSFELKWCSFGHMVTCISLLVTPAYFLSTECNSCPG